MITNNKTLLNNDWYYSPGGGEPERSIELPHTNRELPLQYFDERDYQFISHYRRALPQAPAGKRVFLQLDGVMTAFTPSINGAVLEEHRGGYLPHVLELTELLTERENRLEIAVDSREREDINPFGFAIDYLTFGGIYRDAWLCTVDSCFLENCLLHYEILSIEGESAAVRCSPELKINNGGEPVCATLCIRLAGVEHEFALELHSGENSVTPGSFVLGSVALWSTERPCLHTAELSLAGEGFADNASITVGFRELKVTEHGAYLNGRPINFVGLNRHQSFPYVGYAMPRRAQEQDAKILKTELGLNLARSSHYPPSPWFLDECDRQGLLVMEEIPGWQFVSAREDWREHVLADVKGMIERDFNHPGVFTWGVRINESQDDDELYERTNALARQLDPSRPTSGVRCIERSHLLEDIYTMNDFMHDGGGDILRTQERCTGLNHKVPYMITEFCGHTYPTKRFDQEERLIEHALRHGRIQSLAARKEDTMGAVGWCAFDYNTHYDFGSGDRICYHGVMDSFRMPKFAAAVYKSQRPASMGYVLEPLTYWARGERDRASLTPLYVFTNCHTIQIWTGGKLVSTHRRAFFNVHPEMQYLTNPPFSVQINGGDWGEHLPDLEVVGLNNETGQPAIRRRFAANPVYTGIDVSADDTALRAGEQDATRIVIKAVDQAGNLLPYLSESFDLKTTGGIEVIGPRRVSACGGAAAFWVRTVPGAVAGEETVSIAAYSGFDAKITIRIE